MSQIRFDNYVVNNLKYSTEIISDAKESDFDREEINFTYKKPSLGLSENRETIFFKADIEVNTKVNSVSFRSIFFQYSVFFNVFDLADDSVKDIINRFNQDVFTVSMLRVKDIVRNISQLDYRQPIVIKDLPLPLKVNVEPKNIKDV